MFLLQKILSNTSFKKIVAEQITRNKLSKQSSGSRSDIHRIVVEKEEYTRKLFEKLCVLRRVKTKKVTKRLKPVFMAQLLQTFKVLQICRNKMFLTDYLNKKVSNTSYKQNLVRYIVHINLTSTNTLVSVTDIKGNVRLFYSSGQVNLKGKQKTKQPAALINILKRILVKAKFMQGEPLAIHFKNTRSHYERFIVKMLKTKFFIKTIRSYNMQPHNGCRPKKIKRF